MSITTSLPERMRPMKAYKLHYIENEFACGKRVELESNSFVEIIQMARGDYAKRDVDVFVDGIFACKISHGEDAICVRRA